MPFALLLITVGGLMVYSALHGIGIADALAGVTGDSLNPHGADDVTPTSSNQLVKAPPAGSHSPVLNLTSIGPEHPTSGLPGYPAHDYFAPAGSPVIAPVDGVVIRLSGHNPAQGPPAGVHGPFGWSVYIKGTDGHTYYLTHMGSRNVHIGQHVSNGDIIGTVGNYAAWGGSNHIHMGVH